MRIPDAPGDLHRSQSGVALVMVLVLLSLLLVVVGEFATAMRTESLVTRNYRAAISAMALAEAGYYRAVTEILPEVIAHHLDEREALVFRQSRLEPPPPPEREDVPLGSGRFSYRITDEQARVDINQLNQATMLRLFTELGVERADRDVIVDSIFDWRDPDEFHRLNGAESDYYLGLPVPYRAKNQNFESLLELLQVRGMTPAIFYGQPPSPGLVDHVTTVGGGVYNVNTATPLRLRLAGLADAEIELLVAGRPYLDRNSIPTQLRRGNPRTISDYFRIEAWGEVSGQARVKLMATVWRRRGQGGVVHVRPLTWQWLPDAAPPATAPEASRTQRPGRLPDAAPRSTAPEAPQTQRPGRAARPW